MPVITRTFDVNDMVKEVDQVIEGFLAAAQDEARKVMHTLQEYLQEYPEYQYKPWNNQYHSKKQELFVKASMARGDWGIRPPYYARRGAMARSWVYSEKLQKKSSTFTVKMDQRIHSGRGVYVQGQDQQHWRMKQIGWPTPKSVSEKYFDKELNKMKDRLKAWRP